MKRAVINMDARIDHLENDIKHLETIQNVVKNRIDGIKAEMHQRYANVQAEITKTNFQSFFPSIEYGKIELEDVFIPSIADKLHQMIKNSAPIRVEPGKIKNINDYDL